MEILVTFPRFQDEKEVLRRYEGWYYIKLVSYYIIFHFETGCSCICPLPSTTLIATDTSIMKECAYYNVWFYYIFIEVINYKLILHIYLYYIIIYNIIIIILIIILVDSHSEQWRGDSSIWFGVSQYILCGSRASG